MLLPRILVLDRGLAMECTEGQNKKKNKGSKKTISLEIHWNWDRLWSFVFAELTEEQLVQPENRGSCAELWCEVPSARAGGGHLAWQYQSIFWEILTAGFILPHFVQTGCKTQNNIRHFDWQGQVYCRGHLRYLCTKSMSPPRICWASQLCLGYTAKCVPQLVDLIKKHNQAKIHEKEFFPVLRW